MQVHKTSQMGRRETCLVWTHPVNVVNYLVRIEIPGIEACETRRWDAIMNLLLSDDYLLQDYPENITRRLRSGHSTCLRFSRKGDYLASGRVDGKVVIFDLDTMGVARKLSGHSKNISSLSWSDCGRYLLSACHGWKAILWDLKDGKRLREVRFRAPVFIAELHPHNQ
jgi:COMPASS component SWD1